jgi:hypothetical protein
MKLFVILRGAEIVVVYFLTRGAEIVVVYFLTHGADIVILPQSLTHDAERLMSLDITVGSLDMKGLPDC